MCCVVWSVHGGMQQLRHIMAGAPTDDRVEYVEIHSPLPTPMPRDKGQRQDMERHMQISHSDIICQYSLDECGCLQTGAEHTNVFTCPNDECASKTNRFTPATEQMMPTSTLRARLQDHNVEHVPRGPDSKHTSIAGHLVGRMRPGKDGRATLEGQKGPSGLRDRWNSDARVKAGNLSPEITAAELEAMRKRCADKKGAGFECVPIARLPPKLQEQIKKSQQLLQTVDEDTKLMQTWRNRMTREPLFQVMTQGKAKAKDRLGHGGELAAEHWPSEYLGSLPPQCVGTFVQRAAGRGQSALSTDRMVRHAPHRMLATNTPVWRMHEACTVAHENGMHMRNGR